MRNHTPARYNTAASLATPRFSEEEIARANAEHDRKYGFSERYGRMYLNPLRLQETHVGPPESLWTK